MRWEIPLILISLLLIVTPGAAWIDGFAYRQEFTINNSASWTGNLTNHPVMITTQYETGNSTGSTIYLKTHAQADFDDVRFTTSGDTLCDIWQESKTDSDVAVFWVEMPTIYNSTTTTGYCYYGNTTTTTTSNGTNTFDFFDDFNDASLDTAKWDQISGTSTEESGLVKIEVTAGGNEEIKTDSAFGNNVWVRSRLKSKHIGASTSDGISTYIALQNTDDGNKGHIAMYSSTGVYGLDYWNVGAAIEYDDIGGVSADTYFIQDILRHSDHTDYYVNNANQVTQSTNYYTGNTKIRSRVNHNTGSEYVYIDWVFAFDNLAPTTTPTIASWDSEEFSPDYTVSAGFTANVTSGDAPLSVQFTDTSTGNNTWWWWDFDGDGDWDNVTSPDPLFTYYGGLVPGYTYAYPDDVDTGYYNVSLYTYNNFSSTDWENKTGYIYLGTPDSWLSTPTISANVTSGTYPLTVGFTGAGNNTPTAWAWDIDGDSSSPYTTDGDFEYTTQNCTHTYNSMGNYTVRLRVNNTAGYSVASEVAYITVTGTAPVAAFSANNTTPIEGQSVLFTDSSTNTPTSWAWSWDDGTPNSTSQHPTHSWSTAGTYTVTLTATNADGSDVETKVDYITVSLGPGPTANFHASDTTPIVGDIVTFTDDSTAGCIAWWWDFDNDGITDSIIQNDVFIYSAAGTYTVNLTVLKDAQYDTELKVGYITVSAAPTPTPTPTVGGGLHFSGNVTLIPTSNASQYYDTIMAGNMTMGEIGAIIPQPLVDALGGGDAGWGLLYFIVFGTAFLILFGRQKNVLIPGLVFILASFFFIQYVLSEELVWIAYALCAAALTGVIVFIALGRR